MKKIQTIILFLVAISLALPAGVFASAGANQLTPGKAASALVAGPVMVVTVKTSQVAAAQNPVAIKDSTCILNQAASQNFLQNSPAVNLNQPASCFSLASAQPVVWPKLSVVLLKSQAQVVVLKQSQIAEAKTFAPKPLARDSTLPMLVFASLGIILYQEKKSIYKLVSRGLENIQSVPSLHQLGILRC